MEIMFLLFVIFFSIYWCVNEKVGLQLGIVSLLSAWALLLYWQFNKQLNMIIPFNINLMWIIIAVIFFCYISLRNYFEKLLGKVNFRIKMMIIAGLSFLMILYRPGLEFVIPGGSLLGLCAGYCLNRRYVGFKSSDVLQRTGLRKYMTLFARIVIGSAVFFLISFRVANIIQRISENQNVELYCFLCCALIGLWVSMAAPWLFIKLRLAGITLYEEKENKQDE